MEQPAFTSYLDGTLFLLVHLDSSQPLSIHVLSHTHSDTSLVCSHFISYCRPGSFIHLPNLTPLTSHIFQRKALARGTVLLFPLLLWEGMGFGGGWGDYLSEREYQIKQGKIKTKEWIRRSRSLLCGAHKSLFNFLFEEHLTPTIEKPNYCMTDMHGL